MGRNQIKPVQIEQRMGLNRCHLRLVARLVTTVSLSPGSIIRSLVALFGRTAVFS
jgi:hypothetical protein